MSSVSGRCAIAAQAERIALGDPLVVRFKMHYRSEIHGVGDWVGLFCLNSARGHKPVSVFMCVCVDVLAGRGAAWWCCV